MPIDHAYEAPILPLPNGTTVIGLPPGGGNLDFERLYEVRLADDFAVLDVLLRVSKELRIPVNLEELVALSHSIDGSVALEQILVERAHNNIKRILAAIDIDGSLFGTVALIPG